MAHRYLVCLSTRAPLQRVLGHCRGCRPDHSRYPKNRASTLVPVPYRGSAPVKLLPCSSYDPSVSIKDHFRDNSQQPRHIGLGPSNVCKPMNVFLSYRPLLLFNRNFHNSAICWKEESTVEKTVKALQSIPDETEVKVPPEKPVETAVVVQKTYWQRFVAEVKHYYHGFRLLWLEIKVSVKLLWLLVTGRQLSRRQNKQLLRTTADLFRLLPFLVFVIVPFMEFLIPFVIKYFPNMLPSTFGDRPGSKNEAETSKKLLKIKLEMAKFLQDTIEESTMKIKKGGKESKRGTEFSEFLQKVRMEGYVPENEEILRFSKLFENDITLETLSRGQLQALNRVLNLPTSMIVPDNMLRFQLRMKLRQLLADDKMIKKEGIDSLTTWELQSAVRERGMRALGVSQERLQVQLQQWLDLHLTQEIPTSLLLLSRTLYLPETLSTTEQLKATISSLPETTTEEAKILAAQIHGEKVDNKAKLDLIKQEEQAIKSEQKVKKEEKKKDEEEEIERQKIAEELEKKISLEELDKVDVEEPAPTEEIPDVEPVMADTAPELEPTPSESLVDVAPSVSELEEEITPKELEEIEVALEEIAVEKEIHIEEDQIQDLREDMQEYKEGLEDLKAVIINKGLEREYEETTWAKRLSERLNILIDKMDGEIMKLHDEKDAIQEDIEMGEVKMKRSAEFKEDGEKREAFLKKLSEKKKNVISINELLLALKRLQKVPNETRLQRIAEVLDEDKDGKIDVGHVLKVIEVLAQENVKLSPSQVTDMVDLLKKEDLIEEEEKEEKQRKHQADEETQEEATDKS